MHVGSCDRWWCCGPGTSFHAALLSENACWLYPYHSLSSFLYRQLSRSDSHAPQLFRVPSALRPKPSTGRCSAGAGWPPNQGSGALSWRSGVEEVEAVLDTMLDFNTVAPKAGLNALLSCPELLRCATLNA